MKLRLVILISIAAVAALVFIILSNLPNEVSLAEIISEQKPDVDTSGVSEVEKQASKVIEEPAKTESVAVTNTRRMIQAHAPLRTDAISNPDSPENQRILQNMVFNTLTNAAQPSNAQ
ncbi:MAG: hypothetical protein AAF065_03865 [Verrucomicrobiota bacterium]